MGRITREEKARREAKQVRVDKAIESLTAQFRRMLTKHAGAMFNCGSPVSSQVEIRVETSGDATLKLEYQTKVADTASFALDDRQNDLPLDDEKEKPTES